MLRRNHGAGAALAIVLASVIWGTTGTAASFAVGVSPLATGAFAMGFAGVLLCMLAGKSLLQLGSSIRRSPWVFVGGSACVAVYPLVFYSTMHWSGVAIGTVVSIASAPIFAAVLERLFCKKQVSLAWCISLVLGVVGVALLAMGKLPQPAELNSVTGFAQALVPDTHYQQYAGVVLGLIAGLTYAGYSLAAKQLISDGVDSRVAMAGLFGCAAVVLLPSLLITGERLFATPVNSMVALYMAIIPMFVGYLLFGYGLKSIDVSTATLITLLEPLVATLLAVVVLQERFLGIGWVGMLLVCLSLLVQTVSITPVNAIHAAQVPLTKT